MDGNEAAQLLRRVAELEAELERFRRSNQFLEASEANLQLFARSIAHDFNNLLSAMLGHASLIETISTPGGECEQSAAVIRRAAERAGELNAQLLQFTRGGIGRQIEVDVNETIREVVDLLRRTLDPDIRIVMSLEASPAIVGGDPGQMHQLLMNLVLNARDAMTGGGELRIESAAAGDGVRLTVRDSGCGIAPDICPRIFDPFFSTKKDGRYSGMGLAIVQRIVESHGGRIQVDTMPGQGTAFHIDFPARLGVRTKAPAGRA
jgi:signal transduction histidine kinase